MSSSVLVAAAIAGASVQQSSNGARCPLMSLRFSSAISDRSKPSCSLAAARSRKYGQDTGMRSSLTFRSQPPKIGIQYPNRMLSSAQLGARIPALVAASRRPR